MSGNDFLAFDLGAESGRALVGSLVADKVHVQEIHRFTNIPVRMGGSVFWDVPRLWNELKPAISLAQTKCSGSLTSIGVDTWGVDFALIDNYGELLGNPHHYRDARTEGVMEQLFKVVPKDEVYSRTGIQFMRLNTLYQLYSMVLRKSKILASASRFLMMPDLFNFWLSELAISEFTDATTTQFHNPRKGQWDFELLQKLNIRTDIFPEIVSPGTLLGKISSGLAAELNIDKEISVAATACHDTAAAVAAAPLQKSSSAYISSGTWSLVGAEVEKPVITERSLQHNFTNEGGVFGKYRLLRNVQGMWLVQECRRIWASQGKDFSYEELVQLATRSRPFTSFIDPDDQRFIAPANMVEEILAYLVNTNQDRPKNEGELIRTILDSLALKYRKIISHLEDLTGSKVDQISIVGGGSRNALLNQITADVCDVDIIAGPAEATSVGNVLMQAVASKVISTHKELRSTVRNSTELRKHEPNPKIEVDDVYNRFMKVTEGGAP